VEDIFYIIVVVVAFIGGVFYGWGLRERHAQRKLDHLLDKFEHAVQEEVNESLIKIKIESHSGMFYVFNQETDEFMGQAKTRKELEDVLAKRYPDKRFMATPENLKVFNEPV
jgi:hypothetical protein